MSLLPPRPDGDRPRFGLPLWPPARPLWSPWAELRADLRPALRVALLVALAGVPTGLLWRELAPRADFRITEDGPVEIGSSSAEVLAGDDAVLVLLLLGLGLLAGAGAWAWRRARGVAVLLAAVLGAALAAVIAWQLGEFLAPGPAEAVLDDVGATVTTGLALRSLPGLAAAPFGAVLAYLVAAMLTQDETLGRPAADSAPAWADHSSPAAAVPYADAPYADAPYADAPPAGRPSD